MSDPLLFSLGKAIVSPAVKLASYAFEKFRRPYLSAKRAPKNLFEYVKPGVSLGRVKEVLGPPRGEDDGQYRYLFAEACVQIDSTDKITVDAVSVGLTSVVRRNRFHVWPIAQLVLGKTTFASRLRCQSRI